MTPLTPSPGHSVFSASAAPRTVRCPGSLQPNLLADEGPSPFAEEGTRAHALAEAWFRQRPARLLPPPNADADDMVDYVGYYVDWCREVETGAAVTAVEQRVDYSRWTPLPNQFGTLDHMVIRDEPDGVVAILTDLKYGKGVRVYAQDNYQLAVYALAVYDAWSWAYDIKKFVLRICQPRLDVFDAWEISTEDLLALGEHIRERWAMALQPDAPRVVGPVQCKFCKVKATCPAQEAVVDDVFGDMTVAPPTPPAELTIERMAYVLTYKKQIEGWLNAVEARVMQAALSGVTVPGWKVVNGRSRRVWRDDGSVVRLVDEGVNPHKHSVITPAEAEDALLAIGVKRKDAKAFVAELTHTPPGKPALVPDTDGRAEYGDIDGVFEEIA